MTWLAKRIKSHMQHEGGTVAYIYGEIGAGKTSYALYTARQIYGTWDGILEWLIFDMKDLIPKLKKGLNDGRVPLIIVDDAGLWANRLSWWELPVREFTKLFNVIRSMVGGLIFTTPSDEIPKQMLKKVKYRIHITKTSAVRKGVPLSKAAIYEQYVMPDFTVKVKKIAEEIFPRHYPIYEEYKRIRNEMIEKKLDEVQRLLEMKKYGINKVYNKAKRDRVRCIRAVVGEIVKKVNDEVPPHQIYKWLMEIGIPKDTARWWVDKVRKLLSSGVDPVDAAITGVWRIKIRDWVPKIKKYYHME